MYADGVRFVFQIVHDPLPHNYPHAMIVAFREREGGLKHVDSEPDLPADRYLLWREKLRRAASVYLRPGEEVEIRRQSPQSHRPEKRPTE